MSSEINAPISICLTIFTIISSLLLIIVVLNINYTKIIINIITTLFVFLIFIISKILYFRILFNCINYILKL